VRKRPPTSRDRRVAIFPPHPPKGTIGRIVLGIANLVLALLVSSSGPAASQPEQSGFRCSAPKKNSDLRSPVRTRPSYFYRGNRDKLNFRFLQKNKKSEKNFFFSKRTTKKHSYKRAHIFGKAVAPVSK
jgi:hypothetical protein